MKKIIIPIECALQNSYRNYHTKGLDYLCIKRSIGLTEKFYFIRHNASHRDLVIPHDHRYNFSQLVLAGATENFLFGVSIGGSTGEDYHKFRYYTPLNGGSGFVHDEVVKLFVRDKQRFVVGHGWYELRSDIHTLKCEDKTILFQKQYADYDVEYTQAFSKDRDIPGCDGLYDRVAVDDIIRMARELSDAGYEVEIVD